MQDEMSVAATLPHDHDGAVLAGRVWLPAADGPAVVAVRGERLVDITRHAATMSRLGERKDAVDVVRAGEGEDIGALAEVLANTPEAGRDASKPWLLAPIDLQAVKAAGVTFARSMLERVIEEQAKGAPEKAQAIRNEIAAHFFICALLRAVCGPLMPRFTILLSTCLIAYSLRSLSATFH